MAAVYMGPCTKTISIIEFANVGICMTTQLHTESPSPGILTISCQNGSNLWNKLINSSFGRMKITSAACQSAVCSYIKERKQERLDMDTLKVELELEIGRLDLDKVQNKQSYIHS